MNNNYKIIPVHSLLVEDGLEDRGCLVASFPTIEEAKAPENAKFGEVKEIRQGYMIVDNDGHPAPSDVDVYWEDELLDAHKELIRLNGN